MYRPQLKDPYRRRRRARDAATTCARAGLNPAWWLALLAAGALLAGIEMADAQDSPAAPGTLPPAAAGNPSAALANSNGVIKPPSGVDPGIHKAPPMPAAQLPTPIIKPSQTANGDSIIQPK